MVTIWRQARCTVSIFDPLQDHLTVPEAMAQSFGIGPYYAKKWSGSTSQLDPNGSGECGWFLVHPVALFFTSSPSFPRMFREVNVLLGTPWPLHVAASSNGIVS